jgi:hypothetical protein
MCDLVWRQLHQQWYVTSEGNHVQLLTESI